MINKWYFMFNGYGQSENLNTGMGHVYIRTRKECDDIRSAIQLWSWQEDVSRLAAKVAETSTLDPSIIISGFSYGGFTTVKFCEQLDRYDLSINLIHLVAPVWRKRDQWMSPWSLFDKWRIYVPSNVQRVVVWNQAKGLIKSHPVIVTLPTVLDARTSAVRHVKVDQDDDVFYTIVKAHRKQKAK